MLHCFRKIDARTPETNDPHNVGDEQTDGPDNGGYFKFSLELFFDFFFFKFSFKQHRSIPIFPHSSEHSVGGGPTSAAGAHSLVDDNDNAPNETQRAIDDKDEVNPEKTHTFRGDEMSLFIPVA